jgi:hypothetical protein
MEAVKNFFIRRCGKSENGRPGPWKSVLEKRLSGRQKPGGSSLPGFCRTGVLSFQEADRTALSAWRAAMRTGSQAFE